MKTDSPILCKIKDHVATITLNRPEVHNAINFEMWVELKELALDLASNRKVMAVVFQGAGGKAFSAGADIKDFPKHRDSKENAKVYADAFESALDAIASIPQPTISMIQGICAGGGCELAMVSDIRIAGIPSFFSIPVAKIGVLLGYKEMQRLVQLVGPGTAAYLLLTAKQVNEQEALSIGLINEIVPSISLSDHVKTLTSRMVQFAPLAQLGNKRVLTTVLKNPGLTHLTNQELDFPLGIFDTVDSHEGYQAFIEKRAPRFLGH